jgi:hypothetical protein
MKKFRKLLIALALLVALGLAAFYGLLQLREKRMWPFNSGLSKILPPSFKQFAYNTTSPDQKVVSSFLHNIKVAYYNIPDPGAVGGGGAINNIGLGDLLVTLNNGQSLVFDVGTGKFTTIESGEVKKIFSSVRDVFAFEHDGAKYLAFLGTTNHSEGCKRISVYLAKYATPDAGLGLTLTAPTKLWETEDACAGPVNNNAGGRIVYQGGKFYLSTGFFMGEGSMGGIANFEQRIDSSFGKVIEVDWEGRSKIISLGHRNPQGLFFAKGGSVLFSTEHAIRGGDELNIIRRKANYGFPCEAYGTYYGYQFDAPQKESKLLSQDPLCAKRDFVAPVFYWSDITGISQGIEYAGEEFHAFNGNLLIGSLAGTSLFRIQLGEANNVMFIERINLQERVRDLNVSDSGKILALTDGGNILVLSSTK